MDRYREEIVQIINSVAADEVTEIILFGSRARNQSRESSDYDIAVKAAAALSGRKLYEIKDKLEESNIPFKVDEVDYAKISPELKEIIDREGTKW